MDIKPHMHCTFNYFVTLRSIFCEFLTREVISFALALYWHPQIDFHMSWERDRTPAGSMGGTGQKLDHLLQALRWPQQHHYKVPEQRLELSHKIGPSWGHVISLWLFGSFPPQPLTTTAWRYSVTHQSQLVTSPGPCINLQTCGFV